MKPTTKVIHPHEVVGTSAGPMLPGYVCVEFHWDGVDRPCSFGIVCKAQHAPRLEAACKAGVLFKKASIQKDIYGKTYVEASCQVWGKRLNSDLKRLGY